MEEIKMMRKAISFQTACNFMQTLAILGIIVFLALKRDEQGEDPSPVSITANPVNTNTVSMADPTEVINERAERQGYYTKDQFAELMGFSVRTLDRRISEGRLDPAPIVTESGKVQIPLETRLVTD